MIKQTSKRIAEIINDAIAVEQAGRVGRKRSGKWSPSSFGRCYRYQYWNRKDEPKSNPPDDRTYRVFRCGNLFEDYVISEVKKQFPSLKTQVKIETDDVFGYADFVLNGEVGEIKSQNSRAFWYMAKEIKENEKTISDLKENNVLQGAFYAMVLGKEFLRLVFISKDDLCIEEFRIKITDDIKEKLNKELSELNEYWSKEELPPASPRAYGKDKKTGQAKECGYCPYKDACFAMEQAEGRTRPDKEVITASDN